MSRASSSQQQQTASHAAWSRVSHLQVAEFGRKQTGLDQYAIVKFAEAFEIVPRMLAENSGLNATDVVGGWGRR